MKAQLIVETIIKFVAIFLNIFMAFMSHKNGNDSAACYFMLWVIALYFYTVRNK